MRKPLFLVTSLLLVACTSLSTPSAQFAVYDLGPIQSPSARHLNLHLNGVVDTPGLTGLDMRYRLAYKEPTRVYAYTESRWLMPPAELLGQRLNQRFAFNNGSPCKLRVELTRFDQIFDSPHDSKGIVGLRAIVSRMDKRQPDERREFLVEKPAESADARGGVAALAVATDEAIAQLSGWAQAMNCEG